MTELTLSGCVEAFVEKAGQWARIEVSGPSEEGVFVLTVDDVQATLCPDGSIICEDESLTRTLEKHFAPYKRFVSNGGPSELPRGEPEDLPDEPEPFQAEPEAKVEAPAPTTATVQGGSIWDQIVKKFGYDLLEVLGETGTMKTQGLVALAIQSAKAGKKVYYLDTENNCGPEGSEELRAAGVKYHYTPVVTEIDKIIRNDLPKMGVDLIIIDSVGMPILRRYAMLSQKQRGDALLEIIAWFGILKEITYSNKCIAFVSNQQGSEFGKTDAKERGDYRPGFGDKANYIPGAILLAKKVTDSPSGSKAYWQTWRLRRSAWGTKIFQVNVNDAGSQIGMAA